MRKRRQLMHFPARRNVLSESAAAHLGQPLNQEALRNIRLRESQATKGPWVVQERVIDDFITDRSVITAWKDSTYKWPLPIVGMHKSENGFGTWIDSENADFIVGARTDVPNLLVTLDVFAHPRVYDALLRYYKNGDCPIEDKTAIERALDVSWTLMKSQLE